MPLNGDSLFLGITLSAQNINLGSSELVYGVLSPVSVSHYLHALMSKIKINTRPTVFSYGIVDVEYDTRSVGKKQVPVFIRQGETPFSPEKQRVDHPYYDELRAALTVKVAFEVKDIEIFNELLGSEQFLLDTRFVGAEVLTASIKSLDRGTYHKFFYGSRVMVDKTASLAQRCADYDLDMNEAFFDIVADKRINEHGKFIRAQKRSELQNLATGWTVPMVVGYRQLEAQPVKTRKGVRDEREHIFTEYVYGIGEFCVISKALEHQFGSYLFNVELNDDEIFYITKGG